MELVGRGQCLQEEQAGPQELGPVMGLSMLTPMSGESASREEVACRCQKRALVGATLVSQVSQGGCVLDPWMGPVTGLEQDPGGRALVP